MLNSSPNRRLRPRGIALTVTALIAAVAVAACGSSSHSSNSGAGASSGGSSSHQSFSIGFVTNQSSYFYQQVGSALSNAASKDGGSIITVNSNNDPSAELKDVQNLVSRGVKAIVMGPVSPTSSLAAVKLADNAKIPVICYNTCLSDADSKKYAKAYIEANNTDLGTETGKYAAAYIKKQLGGSAQIALLNCDEFLVCRQRKDGFKAALKGVKVSIVADQTGYAPDTAAKVAQEIMAAHPDVDAIWGVNDGATEGARAAVAGHSGHKVVVFGTDISPQIAGFLTAKDDIVQATTGQDAALIGTDAYKAVKQAMAGQTVRPFTQLVPGSFFSRSDPAAVKKYLASAKS